MSLVKGVDMKIGNMVVPSLGRVENISRESLDIVRVSNVRFEKIQAGNHSQN